MTSVSTAVGRNPLEEMEYPSQSTRESEMQYLGAISKMTEGKPFNITVIQVCAPTSNAEEAEVEWFCEDLQDLLELTPKKDVLYIKGDWSEKVGNQEIPGVTGKFEIEPKYCILDSFVDYEGYSISSKGFLTTVVDIMVI